MGEYTEQMPFGGQLKVTKTSWKIEYYFPGPDLRHRGEFKRIPGASIDSFIRAFRSTWSEYIQLKGALPAGGEFAKVGTNGIHIRVGGYAPGILLHSYKQMVSSETDLDRIVTAYEQAKQRAAQIQSVLLSL